jgi:hypothetical protein
MLPQLRPRSGMLHRLALKSYPALFVVLILYGAVPVTEVADFCQPATFTVLPLLCRPRRSRCGASDGPIHRSATG